MAFGERGGDIEPGGLVDGLDGLDDRQRPFQHGDGAAVIGLVGRGRAAAAVAHRAADGGVAEHGGLGEVVGQLGERDVGRVAVDGEDRLAEGPVQPGPLGDGELAGERVADDGVGEGEAPGPGLDQQAGADGFVEAVDDRVGGAGVGHLAQHPHAELEPAQRGDGQGLVGRRRQARQAPTHDIEHALGQVDVVERAADASSVRRPAPGRRARRGGAAPGWRRTGCRRCARRGRRPARGRRRRARRPTRPPAGPRRLGRRGRAARGVRRRWTRWMSASSPPSAWERSTSVSR